jgi:hypothetical protein
MNLKRKKQIPRFQSGHTQGYIGKTLWHKAFGKKQADSTKITTPAEASLNARTSSERARCDSHSPASAGQNAG